MSHQKIITATKNWLTSFIIAHNICPFARQVYDNDSIRFVVVESRNPEDCLQTLIEECQYLDAQTGTETTLLIFENSCAEFDDYLDLVAVAEQLLNDQGYEGVYQLASFHPDYCFAESSNDDPANYTNRSPYPMLHLIRESSIERALQAYPHPERIPERNIKLTRSLGLKQMQAQLAACKANPAR
ncbi:MAG: DUF1415 domain-containing protein [Methylomonas sp.]